MSNWTPQDWTIFFIAFCSAVGAVLSAVSAFYSNISKTWANVAATNTQRVEDKLDDNTQITKDGTAAAVTNAKRAVAAANSAEIATNSINSKLNGGIDAAIKTALEPLHATLVDHIEQDKKDLEEVKDHLQKFATSASLAEIGEYVHKRNHDLLNAINGLSLQLRVAQAGKPERETP